MIDALLKIMGKNKRHIKRSKQLPWQVVGI